MHSNDPPPTPNLSEIRRILAIEVDRTSLRAVARGIDMSPTGLNNLLEFASPSRRTLRNIDVWLVTERPRCADTATILSAAGRVLARGEAVDPPVRAAAQRAVDAAAQRGDAPADPLEGFTASERLAINVLLGDAARAENAQRLAAFVKELRKESG